MDVLGRFGSDIRDCLRFEMSSMASLSASLVFSFSVSSFGESVQGTWYKFIQGGVEIGGYYSGILFSLFFVFLAQSLGAPTMRDTPYFEGCCVMMNGLGRLQFAVEQLSKVLNKTCFVVTAQFDMKIDG